MSIPDSVTSIGWGAFSNCTALADVVWPGQITDLGDNVLDGTAYYNNADNWEDNILYVGPYLVAVANKDSAKSYTVRDGTRVMGNRAFASSGAMTSISLPQSLTAIPRETFSGCTSLEEISIPNGVTDIAYRSFYGCSSLINLEIPDSVTDIEYVAFAGCSSLTSVAIGNNVATIGEAAFSECSSLESVAIPDSVTSILDYAFSGCSSLTSVAIGNSVAAIGEAAFGECSSLESVTIPYSVTSIEWGTFSGCSSLKSVDIPDGVTSILDYAFYDCSSLPSIIIPDSVTCIGENVFNGCTSLQDVYYPGTEEQWQKIEIGNYNDPLLNATIHFGRTGPVELNVIGGENAPTCRVDGQTLTVTCDRACVAAYKDADGNYVRLTPTANADGSYSYTLPEGVSEVTVAVRGDLDGDGKLTAKEARRVMTAVTRTDGLDALQMLCADLNGDGKISAMEARQILSAVTNSAAVKW